MYGRRGRQGNRQGATGRALNNSWGNCLRQGLENLYCFALPLSAEGWALLPGPVCSSNISWELRASVQLSREHMQLGIEKQQGATPVKSTHCSLKVTGEMVTGQIVRELH